MSLLSEPKLGDLHRAGCHLILAHSPHEPIYHAEKAVQLYKAMNADITPSERKSHEALLKAAEDILAVVTKEKREIDEEAGEFNEEDFQADLDRQIAEVSEDLAQFEAEAEAQLARGDFDDDDEPLEVTAEHEAVNVDNGADGEEDDKPLKVAAGDGGMDVDTGADGEEEELELELETELSAPFPRIPTPPPK